jgi:hypothetical protein
MQQSQPKTVPNVFLRAERQIGHRTGSRLDEVESGQCHGGWLSVGYHMFAEGNEQAYAVVVDNYVKG